MSNIFLKFKERQNRLRLVKSAAIGLSAGIGLGGVFLILTKLDLLGIAPIFSLPIAVAALAAAGAVAYFAFATTDERLAKELDERFDLKEKVQTMIAFEGESGDMLSLQRRDADRSLGRISVSELKIERLWIYITALSVALVILLAGILVPNVWKKNQNPPYRISLYQEEGLLELVRYVNASGMEEEYRSLISRELDDLLLDLRQVDNERDMRSELAESMAYICAITYDSSNSTEILNLLWKTDDRYLRYMAKWLDTSSTYNEGDFAERLMELIFIISGEDKLSDDESEEDPTDEELAELEEQRKKAISQALDGMVRKYAMAFESAEGLSDDEICLALDNLFGSEGGLSAINSEVKDMTYAEIKEAVTNAFYGVYDESYAAVAQQRINASVGEYTMTRLASLFAVPMPEFERPDFVKNGESVEGNKGESDDDNKPSDGKNDGGIGEGATFGSKDLVLDPFTGKFVEYGELIDTYYGIVNAKIESGSYTEEQKEMILKYFALLYSGIEEKTEGN